MRPFLARYIFDVDDAPYSWADAIAAARIRGEWSAVVNRARQSMHLLNAADQSAGLGDLVSEPHLEHRASSFRRERSLEAAEDLEAWLETWDLSASDWSSWLRAQQLRGRFDPCAASAEPPPRDLALAVHAELVCSRHGELFAKRLAERVAVYEMRRGAGCPCEVDTQRAGLLVRQERSFREFLAEGVSKRALQGEISRSGLELTRLSYDAVAFDNPDQASEASLLVAEDGLSLDAVARSAGTEVLRQTSFIGEIEGGLHARLAGARPGAIVGPLKTGSVWVIAMVVERFPPSLEDPAAVNRATSALIGREIAREVSNRVRWRWRL